MKANRLFVLTVRRGGREPAFMAERGRTDRIEVTAIEDGELLLYWELAPREASQLARRVRADLIALEAEEFLALWEGTDG